MSKELKMCPICGKDWIGKGYCNHNLADIIQYANIIRKQLEMAMDLIEYLRITDIPNLKYVKDHFTYIENFGKD